MIYCSCVPDMDLISLDDQDGEDGRPDVIALSL